MFLNQHVNLMASANIPKILVETERSVIGHLLNWVRIIGTGIALIMLTYMSFRYFNTGPTGRGEIKQRMTHFVIGAVAFIGASNILYYAEIIAEDLLKGVFS